MTIVMERWKDENEHWRACINLCYNGHKYMVRHENEKKTAATSIGKSWWIGSSEVVGCKLSHAPTLLAVRLPRTREIERTRLPITHPPLFLFLLSYHTPHPHKSFAMFRARVCTITSTTHTLAARAMPLRLYSSKITIAIVNMVR